VHYICCFNHMVLVILTTFRNLPLVRGPVANFVDSPNYSESELCRGVVMVYFSKYLPWQEIYFLQRSIHFSKTCCGQLTTLKFLASELCFHSLKKKQKSHGAIFELNSVFDLEGVRPTVQISPHAISGPFQS
jgi:hypothetical protein